MAEKISKGKQAVVDVMDERIEELEEKLQKVQPLIDELNQLKRARAMVLNERGVSGGGTRSMLDAAGVVRVLTDADESLTASQIANALGVGDSTVRSHLHRGLGVKYQQEDDGTWSLIEED